MKRAAAWLFVGVVLLVAVCGRLAAPYDPYQTQLTITAEPPGAYVLGTDTLGRDVLSRVLHGGVFTLSAGAAAALIAWGVGAVLGAAAVSGTPYMSGLVGIFTLALLALPPFLIALVVVTGLGASLPSTAVAAGVAQAGIAAQVWRGTLLALLREPYLDGAAAVGATRWWTLWRHVVPNALPVLIAYGCVLFASSVLMISGLSFLGLGGDPATPEWGNLLADGRRAIRSAPWMMLAPAAALLLVTSALNTAARLLSRRESSSRVPIAD